MLLSLKGPLLTQHRHSCLSIINHLISSRTVLNSTVAICCNETILAQVRYIRVMNSTFSERDQKNLYGNFVLDFRHQLIFGLGALGLKTA